ncbi:hypothetical protein LTR62_006194 [Meristemomyces frigidus]|uniref:Uncharacterized protein n=1 Tax=Meristemomyces frigidus TaxID=1508187 RepID=A0AAN7YIR2_9PEZI|nr:hypothetical protein LTR62_006194 [Meristemomyces frigidus]
MTSNLMDTEAGGEGQQYGGRLFTDSTSKKSGGQLGSPETTTDPSQTLEGKQKAADRSAKTTENMRYGQTITETGGMSGMTEGMDGKVEQEGYGGVEDRPSGGSAEAEAGQERRQQGYGGGKDMDQEVGA